MFSNIIHPSCSNAHQNVLIVLAASQTFSTQIIAVSDSLKEWQDETCVEDMNPWQYLLPQKLTNITWKMLVGRWFSLLKWFNPLGDMFHFFFWGNFSDSKRVEQQLSKMFETTNLSGAKSYRRDDKRHLQRMEVLLHRSVVVRSELKYSPCKWLEDVRSFSRHFFQGPSGQL